MRRPDVWRNLRHRFNKISRIRLTPPLTHERIEIMTPNQNVERATERPWHVEEQGRLIAIDSETRNISVIQWKPSVPIDDEDRANAALICKAVNLFEAL